MQIFTLLMATVEAMQMLIEEGTCSFTQEDEFLVCCCQCSLELQRSWQTLRKKHCDRSPSFEAIRNQSLNQREESCSLIRYT